MSDAPTAEDEELVVLPLQGWSVTQCCVDYGFTINLWRVEGEFSIRIETSFSLVASKEELAIHIGFGSIRELAPALEIFSSSVDRAVVYRSGKLSLNFSNGIFIQIAPDEQYEAWIVTGPHGFRIVSLPGGGIASWGAAV